MNLSIGFHILSQNATKFYYLEYDLFDEDTCL